MGTLPLQYLGNVLYRGRRKKIYFQHLVDKVSRRLQGWQGRFLSPGGRLILVRHVLAAIPIYTLSAMAPPKAILRQVEKLCSNFLWARDDSNLKRVWRAWDRLTFPVAGPCLAQFGGCFACLLM